MKLLLNRFWDAHIKNALHQHLNREKVSVDGLSVAQRLLQAVVFCWRGTSCCSRCCFTRVSLVFLQIFQDPACQGAERLQRSPIELLLLAQAWIFSDEPVVLAVETPAIRALAGLFGQQAAP